MNKFHITFFLAQHSYMVLLEEAVKKSLLYFAEKCFQVIYTFLIDSFVYEKRYICLT